MDVFEKFLNNYSYKFDKGYPDMNNDQDVLLLESILEELGINEGSVMNNSAKAINKILSSPEGKQYNFKLQTKSNRLGNLDKISKDDFLNLLNIVYPNIPVTVHAPGEGPNKKPQGSSKFNMYEFNTEDGNVKIILSGGSNEGEKYEQNFTNDLKSSAGTSLEDIENNNVRKLYQALKINPKTLSPNDIDFAGTANTKRSLSFGEPENVGKIIADIIIKSNGKEYYISLKNILGHTFYNGGNVPFIVFDKDQNVVFDRSKYNNNEIIKNIFEIFSIDINKVVQGLNEYIQGEGEIPNSFENAKISNPQALTNMLVSGFGYGYYYVKEKKDGISIVPLLTPEEAYKTIGDIKGAQIKYPNSETKSLTIKIPLESEIFGNVDCLIELRNTTGNVLPIALKIKTNK
jgi:hypothetical protein